MDDDTYFLKRYVDNSIYSEFSGNLIEKNIEPLQFMDSIFEEIPIDRFQKLKLPQYIHKNLIDLLNHFNLNLFESDFLALIVQIQSVYLLYGETTEDDLFENFQNEKKDLENLINILEKYLSNKNQELHSIYFKFNTIKTKPINNFFVVDDIYKSILKYFKIDKENFSVRKEELLQDSVNNFNYKKGKIYVINKTVKYLVEFLSKNSIKISDNEALQFSGYLLQICQIPLKNNQKEILIYEDIRTGLDSIEYQNMRHYFDERSKTSL